MPLRHFAPLFWRRLVGHFPRRPPAQALQQRCSLDHHHFGQRLKPLAVEASFNLRPPKDLLLLDLVHSFL